MQTDRLIGIVALLLSSGPAVRGQVGFAEDQTDRVRIWNADFFELAIRKADGRLLSITDKTTGQQVSPGSTAGPWVTRSADGTWLGGGDYSPTNPSRQFAYAWNAPAGELTLTWTATGSHASVVTLVIRPTLGPEIDTTLTFDNQSANEVELLAYPVHLAFQRSAIEGVYVPYQEGIRLLPGFFAANDFGSRYPGQMFADFAFTDLGTGSFALYLVHDPQVPLMTSQWLILRDDTFSGGVNKYHHDYAVAIGPGQQWVSPTTVLSVGSTLPEAMDAYWTRSGHHAMPTLEDKLGGTLRDRLAGAVLLKRDFLQGSWTFASFQSSIAGLPSGNLLHLVAFWPRGFDENYPDYLPPHASLGTTGDLQTLVAAARAAGHLVMPYTNPTWWDDEAPTYASLGGGIVARDRSDNPVWETYGTHGGYVVSPYDPAVIARQDQTRDEFTLTVPCDLLFEDQIGARTAPDYDQHPAMPHPTQYTQGLVDVAARSAQWLPIMSEGGFDRLSWYESGFCGSYTVGWHWWPESTFVPYPLVPLWAHENLYFTSHNLASASMANDLPSLTYYVSIGYSLSYDLLNYDATWLGVLDAFQKHLIADQVGVAMDTFTELPVAGRTRTTFANGVVVTANRTAAPMTVESHVLAADGFLARGADGRVRAGVLTQVNGLPLAGGPHYLVFDHTAWRTRIFQPLGDDGPVRSRRPDDWADPNRIVATAVTTSGSRFPRPVAVDATGIEVEYLGSLAGQTVAYIEIVYCRPADADCDGAIAAHEALAILDCLAGPDNLGTPDPPWTPADCLAAFDSDTDADVDLADVARIQRLVEP